MKANELDTLVSFLKPDMWRDDLTGDPQTTYVPALKTWAKVKPLSSRRVRDASQDCIIETYAITTRRRQNANIQINWKIETPHLTLMITRAPDYSEKGYVTYTTEADAIDDRS